MHAQQDERSWQSRAKRWGRTCLRLALVGVALVLAWTLLLFLSGACVGFRSWLERSVSTSLFAVAPIYLTVVIGSYIVVVLPVEWLSYKAEVRHGLSRKGPAGWLRHFIVGYLVGLMLGVVFFYVVYISFLAVGRWWWLGAGLLSVGGDVVVRRFLLQRLISLHHRLTPIETGAVTERLRKMVQRSGATIDRFLQMNVKMETPCANAMVGGLGRNKTIFFTDTLLDALSEEEIESVAAHELGHERHGHLTQSIFLNFAVITTGLLVAHLGLMFLSPLFPHVGIREPADLAAFPLLLLFLILYVSAITPATSAASRHMEKTADRFAVTLSSEPKAFPAAIEKLAELNLVDPDPRGLARNLSRAPALKERIEAAKALAEREEQA